MKKLIVWLTIFFGLYMLFLQFYDDKGMVWNFLVGALQGILGFVGAIAGFKALKNTSGNLRIATLLGSVALFSYGVSLNIWTYYNIVLNIEAPYPSISDGFFALARILLMLILIILLFVYRSNITKSRIMAAIILGVIAGYLVFLFTGKPQTEAEDIITTFFDVFWGISDVITAAFAVIVLRIAGGRIYNGLKILTIGLILSVIADVWFVLRISSGTYWNGEPSDILLTISIGVIAYGIASLSEKNINKIV